MAALSTCLLQLGGSESPFSLSPKVIRIIAVLATLPLPLLLTLVLGLAGGVRRLARILPSIACLLMLLYAGLVGITVRQENTLNQALEQSLQHEGRYLASITGEPWPGSGGPSPGNGSDAP